MSSKHEEKKKGLWQKLREFLYGMAMHEAALVAIQKKAHFEHLFMLITMGNLLGVPIVPHYYTLRLFPYAIPRLAGWKRYMLREKDLTDKADFG